jgi:uncharacterized protein (DUF305 family)
MKHGLAIATVLGSAAAGAALSVLSFLFIIPAASRETAQATPHHHDQPASSMCSLSTGSGQASFYSEMAKVNARMHEDMAVVPSGDVNQDFFRMMIPHHQGAIDMALILLKHQPDERLKRLAQSIVV